MKLESVRTSLGVNSWTLTLSEQELVKAWSNLGPLDLALLTEVNAQQPNALCSDQLLVLESVVRCIELTDA